MSEERREEKEIETPRDEGARQQRKPYVAPAMEQLGSFTTVTLGTGLPIIIPKSC